MVYIKRILGLPFFAGLSLIAVIWLWLKYCRNFVLYGGESIAYTQKNQRKTIKDIYDLIASEVADKATAKIDLDALREYYAQETTSAKD